MRERKRKKILLSFRALIFLCVPSIDCWPFINVILLYSSSNWMLLQQFGHRLIIIFSYVIFICRQFGQCGAKATGKYFMKYSFQIIQYRKKHQIIVNGCFFFVHSSFNRVGFFIANMRQMSFFTHTQHKYTHAHSK